MSRIVKTHSGASAANDTGSGVVDAEGSPSCTMYVVAGTGVTGGTVKLQASPVKGQSGGVQSSDANWVDLGSVTVTSAGTQRVAINEGHRYLRCKISSAVVGGVIDCYIHTSGYGGGYSDRE